MTKCLVALFAVILIVASASGQNGTMLGKSYLQAGLDGYYYHYAEKIDAGTLSLIGISKYTGTPKSEEYGFTPLFMAAGEYYLKTMPLSGGFAFESGSAQHTYDGASSATDSATPTVTYYSPVTFDKTNIFTRIGAYAGPYFSDGENLVGLHAGLLYCYWNRSFTEGVLETYSWYYLPAGVEFVHRLESTVSIGCTIDYRFMLSGSMLLNPGSSGEGITASAPPLDIGLMNGFSMELPVRFDLNRIIGLALTPWFELRPSGISDVDSIKWENTANGKTARSAFLEPRSSSYSVGMTVSLLFGDFAPVRRRYNH